MSASMMAPAITRSAQSPQQQQPQQNFSPVKPLLRLDTTSDTDGDNNIPSPQEYAKMNQSFAHTREDSIITHTKIYYTKQYNKYKNKKKESKLLNLTITHQNFVHWLRKRGIENVNSHLTRKEFQAFFKWLERRIKANLQATRHLNKEALIDEILELVIFTKRAEAAKFVTTLQVLADDSLSMSHFVTALGGVVHSEDVRTLKTFAHSIIRSEKRYEKKLKLQNKLAAAAMRRKQLESTSTHVAIKQTMNESKFSTVKQQLKGGGVFYLCSGPGTGTGTGSSGAGAGAGGGAGGAGAEKDTKALVDNSKTKDGLLVSQDSGLSEASATAATSTQERSKQAIMSALNRVASLQDVDVDALPEDVTRVDTSGPDDVALDILPASPLLSPKLKKGLSSSSFSPRTPHSPATSSSNISLTESPHKAISTSPIKKLFHCSTTASDQSTMSVNNSPLSRCPPSSLYREGSSSASSSSSLLSLKQSSALPGVGQASSRPTGLKQKHLRRQSSNL